jgi:HAD superfamily hydrolase (TIGR01459 family)
MSLTAEDHSSTGSLASAAACASATYPSGSTVTRFRSSLSALAQNYDTILIDQWGVLHDGRKPYPGAVQCLDRLSGAGKQVILISNSGKRAHENEIRLNQIGFPAESYSHLVTSGEIAWQMLAAGQGLFSGLTGKRCLLLTSDDPSGYAAGLPISQAEAEEADFILLAGIDDTKPRLYYEQMIATGLGRGLPMICVNPDLMRITPEGLKPGAGGVADRYQARGGKVRYLGNPQLEIYTHCLMLAATGAGGRVLSIGDSLHHDIAGGRVAGIDTLLVMGGVHADALPEDADPPSLRAAIMAIAGRYGAIPDWAIPSFKW